MYPLIHTRCPLIYAQMYTSLLIFTHTGVYPLMAAAVHGRLSEVTTLLSLGADPTAQLPSGQTAADLAAMQGHHDVMELLMECVTEMGKMKETQAANEALSHYQQHAQAEEVCCRVCCGGL